MKYRVEQIDSQTWLIEEYDESTSVYMYLLTGAREAVLLDTGLGSFPLKQICEELTDLPITVILTHGHVDHIGGSGMFERVYLHKADKELYQLHKKERMRKLFSQENLLPVKEEILLLEGTERFDLGGRIIRIVETPGHSVGSVCILDEERRWLFVGDTCCKAHVLLQLEYSASLDIYIESIRKLLALESEYDLIWPGHHSKPVSKDIPRQFLEASELLRDGKLESSPLKTMLGTARIAEYKDVGIEY